MNEKHVIRRFVKAKKLFSKYAFLLMLCSFSFASAQGSEEKITGTVLEGTNSEPIFGVTVALKGSKNITSTDVTGSFSIVAKIGETLIFSYIGFTKQEVKITSNNLTIRLKEDVKSLDEVVVIGYGKSKRRDITGSVSSISGKDITQTSPTTFDQALQGKVAGVIVQQISGQPGGGVSIQIHGISSISGTNSPLYVIDGVVIPPTNNPGNGSNPLNTINPSEIESIDVLKDASATAIYGSQATNGVVVITTKRGKSGPPKISFEGYFGFQQVPSRLNTVSLQQIATFLNERADVWGFDKRPEFANPAYLGKGTDWQSELFRNAPQSNYSLSVNGGDDRTQYLFSLGYFDQEGIALGSNFKRYSVRLNLDNKTTSWLKIGTSIQLANVVENVTTSNSGVIQDALRLTPDVPVNNADGSWGGISNTSDWVIPVVNPVAMATINTNMNYRYQIFGNAYAEIRFFKDLSLRSEVSGNYDFNTNKSFRPQTTFGKFTTPDPTSGSFSYNQNINTVIRNYFTYSHSYGKSNINVVVGHEANLNSNANVSAARSIFPSNNVQSVSSGDPTTATNGSTFGDGSYESYLGRINFNLLDKYLFTLNIREDGSSNFPTGARWAATSSGAFAWKIKNEKFLENVKVVNDLKLRLGYGITNNQGIPGNTFVSQLTTVPNGLSGIAQYQSNLANPNVHWETTKNGNIGLDGTFFNSKVNFSVDVYDRFTDGLLLKVPLPEYSGTNTGWSPGSMSAPYVNVGSVSNKGIDVRVGTTNISTENFNWKTDITISHNVNEVMSLGNGGEDASLQKDVSRTVVGKPVGSFYGYVYDEIYATASDFQTHALPADQSLIPRPVTKSYGGIWYGDRMYKDLNGDGIIDTRDQTFLGSPLPKLQFGFNNTVSYKNFDLNIFFSGSVGNKVYNQVALSQNNPLNNTSYFVGVLDYARTALIDPNGSDSDVNNVYVTNPNTTIPSLRNDDTNENSRMTNIALEDASFIRCKNITLGYNFPKKILEKVHLDSVRFYANVTNVFIITKYSGMDPEIGSWDPLQAGYDAGYYPQARLYTFGFNVRL
ncbi:SusC/RagA family TonB-linked outer membrane protein [Flavobacterium sp.]|uniref:SusC/RagA family TonB-linked outer membrane protein n=1 Tax=Flavobacterium sp. TaxID=239 RepID=UPI003D105FB3